MPLPCSVISYPADAEALEISHRSPVPFVLHINPRTSPCAIRRSRLVNVIIRFSKSSFLLSLSVAPVLLVLSQ